MFTIKKACICTAWPCKVNNILDRNANFTVIVFYFYSRISLVWLLVLPFSLSLIFPLDTTSRFDRLLDYFFYFYLIKLVYRYIRLSSSINNFASLIDPRIYQKEFPPSKEISFTSENPLKCESAWGFENLQ